MDKKLLENFIFKGFTQPQIVNKTGKSRGSVRYWLNKYNLKTKSTSSGILWSIPEKTMRNIVAKSSTLSSILKEFGLQNKGGNIGTLKRCLDKRNISYSHIPLGKSSNKGRKIDREKIPTKNIMVKESTYSRCHLKSRIIKENIIQYTCAICGNKGVWNNSKLVLILDHINGISNDHRKSNLRFLCPNCNSQQDTFAGRNRKIV